MKKLLQKILAFFHIPWDKFLHFSVSAGTTFLMGIVTFFISMRDSMIASGLFSLGLGLGKEYGDSKAKGNKWDNWDIVADCVGIAVACAIYVAIRLIIGR